MNFPDLIFPLLAGVSLAGTLVCIVLSAPHSAKSRRLGPRHLRKMEKRLPSFLDAVASSLLVGKSLQQSIETAARHDQTQLGSFFETILLKMRSGMTLDSSLLQQAGVLSGGSLSLALLSMASCYRSGSNMVESLSLLATLCRERENLRKKIHARTAQSRMQGYVIMLVPLSFMVLLYFVSPQNMLPVLETATGRLILCAAAALQFLGGILIRTMIRQEILG